MDEPRSRTREWRLAASPAGRVRKGVSAREAGWLAAKPGAVAASLVLRRASLTFRKHVTATGMGLRGKTWSFLI